VAGVRPEHVELLVDGTTTSGAFWAEVDIVEHLGSEKLLNLSVGSGLALIARVAPGVDVHAGQRLLFRVEPTRLRLFDPASGSSIEATPALCSIAVGAASAPVQA
jgi:ABC-type sugar transport system ATPase subunit